jgi:hypothetical protein
VIQKAAPSELSGIFSRNVGFEKIPCWGTALIQEADFRNHEASEEVGRHMKRKTIPIFNSLLVIFGLAASAMALPPASAIPEVSGRYEVIQETEKGGQAQVQIRLQLTNRSIRDLHIQHMTLWDFSHPSKDGTRLCSLVVRSSASAITTQEFIIPRAELDLWKRGTRPRVVLDLATPDARPSTLTVRLSPLSSRNGR